MAVHLMAPPNPGCGVLAETSCVADVEDSICQEPQPRSRTGGSHRLARTVSEIVGVRGASSASIGEQWLRSSLPRTDLDKGRRSATAALVDAGLIRSLSPSIPSESLVDYGGEVTIRRAARLVQSAIYTLPPT
ncbi:hypothetical protein N7462_009456 [Penicillium macrosclerotiorum]|uniref:uncharacterized protein n=1 Tax=Penicillium macrosclerotiorum TaxID=303699 RepID=UPI002548555D|nr:uncharacterized protein N7462_009456 [Penicillium macrosclerotiorum]KAJ5674017.1 hypothetical protein N7462_009456 [Penicillium macrosclerotiorum]